MQVYEIYTKIRLVNFGWGKMVINIKKMWIMWITRCITTFSLKMDKVGCA
ncbi:hypothetical protein CLOSYM_04953 [[Clostridium] symbiosum ATCC 14940]|uniref:Uncharacterized protein n=1 Tax=[Clostridium] symbiosum ATCC 14940 TaxID=411472 RepID=A0ABC9TQK1_CLOSY|nr:hypothetical protein CLOSYM_04953 [[Clostridium] symbiosum ATCC 14940]